MYLIEITDIWSRSKGVRPFVRLSVWLVHKITLEGSMSFDPHVQWKKCSWLSSDHFKTGHIHKPILQETPLDCRQKTFKKLGAWNVEFYLFFLETMKSWRYMKTWTHIIIFCHRKCRQNTEYTKMEGCNKLWIYIDNLLPIQALNTKTGKIQCEMWLKSMCLRKMETYINNDRMLEPITKY